MGDGELGRGSGVGWGGGVDGEGAVCVGWVDICLTKQARKKASNNHARKQATQQGAMQHSGAAQGHRQSAALTLPESVGDTGMEGQGGELPGQGVQPPLGHPGRNLQERDRGDRGDRGMRGR